MGIISAAEATERLCQGNRRFVSGDVDRKALANRTHQTGAADEQSPIAIVLACSDSRVPTELIFDQGIGDLFVIRVAGNIVAPSQICSIIRTASGCGMGLRRRIRVFKSVPSTYSITI